MDRISYMEYKGKEIMCIDYSNLKCEEIPALIEEVKRHCKSRGENSVLSLSNFEGMRFNSDIINAFKELREHAKKYMKAGAVIGIKGLQKIAYSGVMKLSSSADPLFESREEALDWLVKQ